MGFCPEQKCNFDCEAKNLRARSLSPHRTWHTKSAQLSDGEVDQLERIKLVLKLTVDRVLAMPAEIVAIGTLNGLQSNVDTVATTVRDYTSTNDAQHLATASMQLDAVLNNVGALAFPIEERDLASLRGAIERYETTISVQLKRFTDAAAEHSVQINALAERFVSATGTIETQRDQLVATLDQLRADIQRTTAELEQTYISTQKHLAEQNEASLTTFRAVFSEAQTANATAHEKAQASRQEAADNLIDRYGKKLAETDESITKKLNTALMDFDLAEEKLRAEFEVKAAEKLDQIETHLLDVQKLVGVIGDLGVTSGHKTAADRAGTLVLVWQFVTVAAMAVLILVAFSLTGAPVTWQMLAGKVYISVAVGALAAYGANQAGRYQDVERRNRKLELELKAIGPFLEPIAETERNSFRIQIADRFFGHDDGAQGEPGPASLVHWLGSKKNLERLDQVLQVINRFRKPPAE